MDRTISTEEVTRTLWDMAPSKAPDPDMDFKHFFYIINLIGKLWEVKSSILFGVFLKKKVSFDCSHPKNPKPGDNTSSETN